MAVIGLMIGSVIGTLSGLIGWLVLDMSALSALTVYVFIAIGMVALTLIVGAARTSDNRAPAGAEVYQH